MTTGIDAISATADFAASALSLPLPQPVERQLGVLLLEGLSWMILGTQREEGCRMLGRRDMVQGACSVTGSPVRTSSAEAARINASLSQVYDCNDGRRMAWIHRGLWHPGRYIIPSALALAEQHGLPGAALLRLMAMGYDIGGKIQTVPNEIAGPMAVSAMAAAALGGSTARLRSALVLGYFSFPQQARWPEDLDLNHLKYGLMVRAGMGAAEMAGDAVDLPEDQCRIALREPFYPARSEEMDAYECMQLYVKPFPCCRSLHGPICLALEARRNTELRIEDIASIDIALADDCETQRLPYRRGMHYKCAQFSVPYVVACALTDGDVGRAQFDQARLEADDIHAVQAKIHIAREPLVGLSELSFREPARMRITTQAGREFVVALESVPGSKLKPLSPAEHQSKFLAWTDGALSRAQQHELIRLVDGISDLGCLDAIVEMLRLVRPRNSKLGCG